MYVQERMHIDVVCVQAGVNGGCMYVQEWMCIDVCLCAGWSQWRVYVYIGVDVHRCVFVCRLESMVGVCMYRSGCT